MGIVQARLSTLEHASDSAETSPSAAESAFASIVNDTGGSINMLSSAGSKRTAESSVDAVVDERAACADIEYVISTCYQSMLSAGIASRDMEPLLRALLPLRAHLGILKYRGESQDRSVVAALARTLWPSQYLGVMAAVQHYNGGVGERTAKAFHAKIVELLTRVAAANGLETSVQAAAMLVSRAEQALSLTLAATAGSSSHAVIDSLVHDDALETPHVTVIMGTSGVATKPVIVRLAVGSLDLASTAHLGLMTSDLACIDCELDDAIATLDSWNGADDHDYDESNELCPDRVPGCRCGTFLGVSPDSRSELLSALDALSLASDDGVSDTGSDRSWHDNDIESLAVCDHCGAVRQSFFQQCACPGWHRDDGYDSDEALMMHMDMDAPTLADVGVTAAPRVEAYPICEANELEALLLSYGVRGSGGLLHMLQSIDHAAGLHSISQTMVDNSAAEPALCDDGASFSVSCVRDIKGAVPGSYNANDAENLSVGNKNAGLKALGSYLFVVKRFGGKGTQETVVRRMKHTPDLHIPMVISEPTEVYGHAYRFYFDNVNGRVMITDSGSEMPLLMSSVKLGWLKVERVLDAGERCKRPSAPLVPRLHSQLLICRR